MTTAQLRAILPSETFTSVMGESIAKPRAKRGSGRSGLRKTSASREACCWANTVSGPTVVMPAPCGSLLTLPIYTTTEGNAKEHWRTKKSRADRQMAVVRDNLNWAVVPYARCVKLIRLAPGTLDAHDNLPSSMKHIVDAIAAVAGVDDKDTAWAWQYDQEKSKQYGVRIEIWDAASSPPRSEAK